MSPQTTQEQSSAESFAPERPTVLFEDTGSSLVPFRYSALQQPDSVCLLKLTLSATGTDVLSCSFLDVALSANPEYEVLSGFWGHQGSPFRPVSLLADGQSCKITAELAQALFRFRRRDAPSLLWIQSLCVNMDDTGERSGQVERLRHILLAAQRLIVWLGPAQDDSDLVFQHVRSFGHLRGEYERVPSWPQDEPYGRRAFAPGRLQSYPDRLEGYPQDADAAFRKLCARAWFYRPWSISELALSKDIVVVCGDHELGQHVSHINPLSWLRLPSLSPHSALPSPGVSFYEALNIPVLDASGHVSTLCLDHWERMPDSIISMSEAYRMVRACHASDPRDSVFAIAALELVAPVEVDYRLSVSEVYQQATFALLSRHRSIQVLRRLASPSRRGSELPSWTLDFNSPLETASALWALPGPRFLQDRPPFDPEKANANRIGLWPADSQVPRPRHERRTNTLVLTGILMETIAAIGPAMPAAVAAAAATTTQKDDDHPPLSDDDIHVRFRQILHDWETLAVTHLLHHDDPSTNSTTTCNGRRFLQPVSDAFLDTLIAHDAHDVLRNDPPRPPVSSEADRGRRWYMHDAHRGGGGTTGGVLSAAEPGYFALRGEGEGGRGGGEKYCLPAGPWWALSGGRFSVATNTYPRGGPAVSEGAFGQRVARACADKRFFVTDKGSMGLAPAGAMEGDVLAIFPTGQFPMVLQPCGGQDETGGGGGDARRCRLVGEGFLYDWWRYVLPVFEHRNKWLGCKDSSERLGYAHLLTEFALPYPSNTY